MNSTIKAIKDRMTPPARLRLESRASNLVAEWQHGPQTLSGLAGRKLRLALAPNQPAMAAA
jgi:hypothetical protein